MQKFQTNKIEEIKFRSVKFHRPDIHDTEYKSNSAQSKMAQMSNPVNDIILWNGTAGECSLFSSPGECSLFVPLSEAHRGRGEGSLSPLVEAHSCRGMKVAGFPLQRHMVVGVAGSLLPSLRGTHGHK